MCKNETIKFEAGKNYEFVDPRIEALQDQINNLHHRIKQIEIYISNQENLNE